MIAEQYFQMIAFSKQKRLLLDIQDIQELLVYKNLKKIMILVYLLLL